MKRLFLVSRQFLCKALRALVWVRPCLCLLVGQSIHPEYPWWVQCHKPSIHIDTELSCPRGAEQPIRENAFKYVRMPNPWALGGVIHQVGRINQRRLQREGEDTMCKYISYYMMKRHHCAEFKRRISVKENWRERKVVGRPPRTPVQPPWYHLLPLWSSYLSPICASHERTLINKFTGVLFVTLSPKVSQKILGFWRHFHIIPLQIKSLN